MLPNFCKYFGFKICTNLDIGIGNRLPTGRSVTKLLVRLLKAYLPLLDEIILLIINVRP